MRASASTLGIALIASAVAGCDEPAPRRTPLAPSATSPVASTLPVVSSSSSVTTTATSAPSTFDDATPTLHLRAPRGPFPTFDDACDAITATKSCERATVAIANATGAYLEAGTLRAEGFVHPCFRMTGGWYVAVPAQIEELRDGEDVQQHRWNLLRPLDARTEDVVPGGEPELVMRFTQRIDRAFNGAVGDTPTLRKPSWIEELAVVCATTPKLACLGPILGAPSLATAATGWVLHSPPHVPVPHLTHPGADAAAWSIQFPAGDVYVLDAGDHPKSADGASFTVAFP